jgi:crotonobetainyl-CoA:carnitine CoA-transferase CaiB-like acyl-CoA transferase
MNYLVGGVVPKRQGTAHPNIVPYQVMPSADGYFMLAVGNDGQFARFCGVLGEPALATDPRYATNASRVAHRDELVAYLEQRLTSRPSTAWLTALEQATVPCAPVNTLDQVFDDPQIKARGMRIDLPHPVAGSVPGVANPVRFSATPVQYRHAAPELGKHTQDVLHELLDLDAVELTALDAAGVIALYRGVAPG